MSDTPIGRFVYSKAGRDKKRCFVIVTVDAERDNAAGYVSIADGQLRKLEKPKRKKLRHLEIVADGGELRVQIEAGTLTNKQLYQSIQNFEKVHKNNQTTILRTEGSFCRRMML